MGVDSKRGGTTSVDDGLDEPASTAEAPRRPSSPLARPKSASVESSLDAFIARAKDKPLDVTEFDTGRREKVLRDEVDDLKARLGKAEARTRRSLGMAVGGFVVGGALVFAVSFFIPRTEKTPAPAQPPEAQVHTAPTVTPIEPPVKALAPELAAPPQEAAAPEAKCDPFGAMHGCAPPQPTAPEQGAPKATDNAVGRAAKRNTIKRTPETPPPTEPKPAPTAKKQGSDQGLFDPFR